MTGDLTQLFDVLEQVVGRPLPTQSISAARFITHLRYFFVRVHKKTQVSVPSVNLEVGVRTANPEAYAAAVRLQAVLELRLGVPLRRDEVTYLTLHVARLLLNERAAEV